MILKENTIEEWLGDCESFTYEFKRHSLELRRAIGIDLSFVSAELNSAHAEWVSMCEEWKAHRFDTDIESLSYTKILSILLYCLCKRTFISEIRVYEATGRKSEHNFVGSPNELEAMRGDFVGAPEVVSALDFCFIILIFYETNRIDKKNPVDIRLTFSMRHDLIYYLSTNCNDALSVYMIIKALFSRD